MKNIGSSPSTNRPSSSAFSTAASLSEQTKALIRFAVNADTNLSSTEKSSLLEAIESPVARAEGAGLTGPLLLNATDAAEFLGVGRTKFHKLVSVGIINGWRLPTFSSPMYSRSKLVALSRGELSAFEDAQPKSRTA